MSDSISAEYFGYFVRYFLMLSEHSNAEEESDIVICYYFRVLLFIISLSCFGTFLKSSFAFAKQ